MAEIDDVFNDFARCFAGLLKDAKPIAYPKQLDRKALDLSLNSLKTVDTYLSYLHKHKDKISDEEWHSTVLYGGAYVGGVICNETEGLFSWIDYEDYMKKDPKMKKLIPERSAATCAFLVTKKGKMVMPMNKIARYIDEGDEHSVHFFAKCEIGS